MMIGTKNGAVAQLGERLTGSQEVVGSTPISSTILLRSRTFVFSFAEYIYEAECSTKLKAKAL